jgi:hypothetical protein
MHVIGRIGALAAVAASVVLTISLSGTAQAAAVPLAAHPSNTVDSVTFDGTVRSVAYFGPTIFVAGEFQNAIVHGKKTPRTRLAAIDATTGYLYPWVPTANGTVWSLVADSTTNTVYIGGEFTSVNGQPRSHLARLNFSGGLLPFNHTITGTPYALASGVGRLYVGGLFSAVDGRAVSNLASFSLANDAYDPGWAASANQQVRALTVSGTRVYIGGQFHNVDHVAGTARLAAVHPVTGVRDASFAPVIGWKVWDIVVGPDGTVYAGMGGKGGGHAIALASNGGLKWQVYADGDVQAIAYLNGVVYYGGHFDNICSAGSQKPISGACIGTHKQRVKLAAADATNGAMLSWNPTLNGVQGVEAMAANPSIGKLSTGGEFTTVGGTWWPRFVQFG